MRYANVSIAYDASNKLLSFSSINDFDAVVTQLNTDYENYNDNYNNNYPGLTAEQMDSVDQITQFDELQTFINFENNFSCFTSRRSFLATTETDWLNSNFQLPDPDDFDFLIEDAENTLFNENYLIKIGGTVYEMKTDGLYDVLTGSQAKQLSDDCFSNHHASNSYIVGDRKFKIKAAINSWLIRSGAKGKVVAFKQKNGSWKRSRAKLAVFVGGRIFDHQCNESDIFSDRNPVYVGGFKNRKQLKVSRHQPGTIWKTQPGLLGSTFDFNGGFSGNAIIQ
jgi:hypothetical protein